VGRNGIQYCASTHTAGISPARASGVRHVLDRQAIMEALRDTEKPSRLRAYSHRPSPIPPRAMRSRGDMFTKTSTPPMRKMTEAGYPAAKLPK
jgi:hypothetical protein